MSLFSNMNFGSLATSAGEIAAESDGTATGVAGDLTEAGLNAALGAVPFVGGILTTIASKLNIAANVGLVMKYGLSSWGASTSPEAMKAQFAERIYPHFTESLKHLTPETMGSGLTKLWIEMYINQAYHKKLRRYHANARSTQLALDWSIIELGTLVSGVEKIVAGISAKGVDVETTNFTAYADAYSLTDMKDGQGTISNGDVMEKPLNLKRFEIDADQVRDLAVDEKTGEVKKSSIGLGTIATVAGLAMAIFKK